MAKVTLVGQAIVITSGMKLDDLKMIKKYRPEALSLYEGEGADKVPVFSIGITNAGNGINGVGAEFSHQSEEGYAQITLISDVAAGEDAKEAVSDKIGRPILKLNQLEATLSAVLEEIAAEKATILESISVVG